MGDILTTINPNTGTFTKENEFINSWKWEYDLDKINQNSFPYYSLNNKKQIRTALIEKYNLDYNSILADAFKIHALHTEKVSRTDSINKLTAQRDDLLNITEIASRENKDLKTTIKKSNKNKKNLIKDLTHFLSHKEYCDISKMKIIGRKNKTKCNCGLSEILERE